MAELLAKRLLERQREEVTGSKIYANLARVVPEPKNKEVLKRSLPSSVPTTISGNG